MLKPVVGSFLTAMVLISTMFIPVSAQEAWEVSYKAAEQAYDGHNLFEARRQFINALKEARQCKQDAKLTCKLESLADFYVQTDRRSRAEPLYKLLKKLKTKES